MSASSGYGSSGSGPVGPIIETLTGNVGGAVGPDGANNINVVGTGGVVVTGNPGTNTLTISDSNSVTYTEDVGTATPAAAILNVIGGAGTAGININTFGSGNTIEIILNDSILLPSTNNTGTMGVIFINANTFMHAFGTNNTFLGSDAGNLTLTTATDNVGLGEGSLQSLTTGDFNVSTGSGSLLALTSGSNNCAYGDGSLTALVSGDNNIALGEASGSNLAGAESNNILIGNDGILAESATIRVGTGGTHTAAYVAGIYNQSYASPSGVVQIDSNNKLGSSAGTNGQLLIGSTGASPVWANLTSTGGSVVITNGAGTINLEATGTGAGASSFPADAGIATEAAGVLNIFSGATSSFNNTNTFASGNTVRVRLNDSIGFPATNGSGTTGVISISGARFMHAFGTGNTFLGSGAGNLTLTPGSALDNVGIGESVLPALTTSPSNTFVGSNSGTLLSSGTGVNTSIGFASMDNLVSGTNNIAVGVLAGTNYTTNESNNILIGSFGTVGDNQTIRIGRTQTAAYMEGVYGASIGTTNAPVFIDNNGKLGTLEAGVSLAGSSFMAVVSPQEILPSSGSQTYLLGTNLVETILWDDFGSAFFPGSGVGSPATFTAPVDGRYEFKWNFLISIIQVTQLTIDIYVNSVQTLSSQKGKYSTTGAGNFSGSFYVSGLLTLAAGDVVTFGTTFVGSALNQISFLGGNPPSFPYNTWVSGTLLKTT